jgi:Tol biopolymer transport system component
MIKLKHLLTEQRIDLKKPATSADAMLNSQFKLYDEKNTQVLLTMNDNTDDTELTMKAFIDASVSDVQHAGYETGEMFRLEYHYNDPEDKTKQVEEFYNGMADGEAVFNVENSAVLKSIKQIKITNLGE